MDEAEPTKDQAAEPASGDLNDGLGFLLTF